MTTLGGCVAAPQQSMVGFEDIVGQIYEAATEPDLWASVLHEIGRSVGALGGALLVARKDRWIGWKCSPGTPVGLDEYLRSDAPLRSQITTRLVGVDRAGFVGDQDVLPPDAWLADPLMTEYATRVGMHHAAATAIHVPNGDLAVVHLHRAAGLPVFNPQDIARLDLYRPHVARAAMLAARWRLERLRAAGDAFALVGLPAAVLDERRQVIFANALMQVALNEAHDPLALSVRSIPIKPTASTGAAVAHVIPAIGSARDLFEGGLAMMVITPANGSGAPSDSLLRALFDLTPSEARIARGIAEGATLEEMAAGHAVTVGTIRAQAKSVFAKTGMHRQAQVAALLVGLGKIR